ncbi:Thioesterase superfamily domain-containing protein [Desulfonema limicola]|uniref:Thioesterase superfamily domain-containing protein n=1 Tax=Desulfonema limicola TaxID=45656 RepID=A0A975B5X0_9BACT|nr:hotdog domain-containing protein [Desulfonema limicola]QTA79352.1 Thioesterase superfamily domain-containing protein [Desulfonema limicola]
MEIITHKKINQALCGRPIEVKQGFSTVELTATEQMAADDMGLVHGGFLFGLADYAAMIAVNDPNVVLGASNVKFLKPVKVNDIVTAQARVSFQKGKKYQVDVIIKCKDTQVFEGEFTCFVLDKHVLS